MTLALPMFPAGAALCAPPAPHRTRRLIDAHGRTVRDLRLSITDRCNFRCAYCMEPETAFMAREELLTPRELARVARLCVGLGVEKLRVTGGEPTVHPELIAILRGLASAGAADLAMTTNGSLCDERSLREWRAAGLTRLTFSLDGVDAGVFSRITRSSSSPGAVVGAIRRALDLGYAPVKVNAVVVRGFNEDQVAGLARLARELGVEMRFIEYMPLDAGRAWDESKLVPASEILSRVGEVFPLVEAGRDRPDATAHEFSFADGAPGRIGIIAPVTRSFCGECSRLRVTADGKVRPCLFSLDEFDLRPLLRGGAGDEEVERFLIDCTWRKQPGHGIRSQGFVRPERSMSAIGG